MSEQSVSRTLLQPFSAPRQSAGPWVFVRGKGIRVEDANAREYIDAAAGLWCATLGFDNERLACVAYEQLRSLPYYHSFNGKTHAPALELADALAEIAPMPVGRVFLANSGSEANDTAIKLIWYYNNALGRPRKKKLISRWSAYHGITVATTSLTGLPKVHEAFDAPLAGFLHLQTPHYFHNARAGETEEDYATRCAEELEALILAEGPDTIAAMFAEPVMGGAGVIVPPRTYYEKIQRILKQYDILLIADEVICGFGRTGKLWGSQTMSLQPDILTSAKALSAAFLPISAVLVSPHVSEVIEDQADRIGVLAHGYTYSGHPAAAAVALEALNIYKELDIAELARESGDILHLGLRQALAELPFVGEIRGIGLMAGIELVQDREARRNFISDEKVGARVAAACERHGLIVRICPNDTIALSPPLTVTRDEIDAIVTRLERAVRETLV